MPNFPSKMRMMKISASFPPSDGRRHAPVETGPKDLVLYYPYLN